MRLDAASELGFNAQLENGVLSKDDNGVIKPFTSSEMDAINAKALELQTEYDAQDYSRKRQEAYALMGNQFEMQYDDMAGWRAAIKAIKDANPKP
jgi:hypothetical protein